MEHCNTNMSVAFKTAAEDGVIPYMAGINKYVHSFAKVDGRWYMTSWGFEPLMIVRFHSYSPKDNIGVLNRMVPDFCCE